MVRPTMRKTCYGGSVGKSMKGGWQLSGRWRQIAVSLNDTEVKTCIGSVTTVVRTQQKTSQQFLALMQLRKLCRGFFQDWDVGIGVFP